MYFLFTGSIDGLTAGGEGLYHVSAGGNLQAAGYAIYR